MKRTPLNGSVQSIKTKPIQKCVSRSYFAWPCMISSAANCISWKSEEEFNPSDNDSENDSYRESSSVTHNTFGRPTKKARRSDDEEDDDDDSFSDYGKLPPVVGISRSGRKVVRPRVFEASNKPLRRAYCLVHS